MAINKISDALYKKVHIKEVERFNSIGSSRAIAFSRSQKIIIPHTSKVYDDDNINCVDSEFDIYITESFHVCVFSIIFKKRFVVFNRDSKGSMSLRIESLSKLFNIETRFIDKEETMKRVITEFDKDVIFDSKDFGSLKEKSIEYLRRNLE